ncbi:MAG: feruloyl-CoA synthase [Vicinamibacterales bacterium]
MADILLSQTVLETAPDGTQYAHSPVALGPYPERITERLEHWAGATPDQTFLARRDATGTWVHLTYADTLRRTRAIAQSLIDRRLSPDRPVVILSGNSLEHALLGMAAMYAGVMYTPLAPAYALLARDYTTLRVLWQALRPGLVFAAEGPLFERALTHVAGDAEVVTCTPPDHLRATPFGALEDVSTTMRVDDAHARVTADTIAKVLYTSGSTGRPKGVINTQRMLCANQAMLLQVMPLLGAEPPVLCDWLPWNHTFGGNHNLGIALYNGGTLFIDDGKPVPGGFETTLANLREIPTTAYFNVPRGYDLLTPHLKQDPGFRATFFSRLKLLFCAAAALRQQVADDIQSMAVDPQGLRIPLVTGLGATESAPFALCAGDSDFSGGRIGVPVPGVELKLGQVGHQLEARLRGPNITPGYWRDPALTAAAFDDEGFYKMGDALAFVDPRRPSEGFTFEGRLAEDFKLSSGTFVRVGPLRQRLLAHLGDLAQELVIAGPGRDEVTVLVFPSLAGCRPLCGAAAPRSTLAQVVAEPSVQDAFRLRFDDFARLNPGHSTRVARALLLADPPSIDAQEATDKGSVNQKAVLANRAALVDQLYGAAGDAVIVHVSDSGKDH